VTQNPQVFYDIDLNNQRSIHEKILYFINTCPYRRERKCQRHCR